MVVSVAVILLTAGLGACGGEGPSGSQAPRGLAEQAAYDAMEGVIERSGGQGATSDRGLRVVGINVVGDRATATVQSGGGPVTAVPMIREDGEWKLGGSLTDQGFSGSGR